MVQLKVLAIYVQEMLFIRFNSNMVQLKVSKQTRHYKPSRSFNSNMVQLKVQLLRIFINIKKSFNSNMVQLKVRGRNGFCRTTVWFQFQYGTIKRPLCSLSDSISIVFQFQYGTIKRECRI